MSTEPKAWFCVCISPGKPDGPAAGIFGPFPEKVLAEQDVPGGGCDNNHLIVYGAGSIHAMLGAADRPHRRAAVNYYAEHPDEIPVACVEMVQCTIANRMMVSA